MPNGPHPAFPARLNAAPDGALQSWVGAFYNEVAPTGLGRHHSSSVLKMRAWSDQGKPPWERLLRQIPCFGGAHGSVFGQGNCLSSLNQQNPVEPLRAVESVALLGRRSGGVDVAGQVGPRSVAQVVFVLHAIASARLCPPNQSDHVSRTEREGLDIRAEGRDDIGGARRGRGHGVE